MPEVSNEGDVMTNIFLVEIAFLPQFRLMKYA